MIALRLAFVAALTLTAACTERDAPKQSTTSAPPQTEKSPLEVHPPPKAFKIHPLPVPVAAAEAGAPDVALPAPSSSVNKNDAGK